MERIIEFSPAYDKRNSNPAKNYGIQGVEIRFVLKGDRGAVQFVLFTSWYLPHVQAELDSKPLGELPYMFHKPLPADLGYHSLTPRYEGQKPMADSCPYLDGKPCYYDGSGLNAEPVYERLLREGDIGVWTALEDFYKKIFGMEEI